MESIASFQPSLHFYTRTKATSLLGTTTTTTITAIPTPVTRFIQHEYPVSNGRPQQLQTRFQSGSKHRMLSLSSSSSTALSNRKGLEWDGDDIRWSSRWKRRMVRRDLLSRRFTMKTGLCITIMVMFCYQTLTTVLFLQKKYASHWPNDWYSMIVDELLGMPLTVSRPVTRNFAFSPTNLSYIQPHRYITSGFVHQGIVQLFVLMVVWNLQPSWLVHGIGPFQYLTTFLGSIVAGNMAISPQGYGASVATDMGLYFGATSGIAGLYGLMHVLLVRMGKSNQGFFESVKGMGSLLVLQFFFHIHSIHGVQIVGGWMGGLILGILIGPKYTKSYQMRRKNSMEYDPVPKDYRRIMGFGIMPTDRGTISLPIFLLLALIVATVCNLNVITIPTMVLKGLWKPGSLGTM